MQIPPQFLLSAQAEDPRTLCDILTATARAHPDAAAIDDGEMTLTYGQLLAVVRRTVGRLGEVGVGRGSRVGIRMPSGSRDLYVAILATLYAGAAYVPVDADDPDERAELVFGEAGVDAIVDADGPRSARPDTAAATEPPARPTPDDDAWIIFTSGSTGKPKGVAVTHRNAAAFVDAEADMFLQDDPIGPHDRVLAGLSVAFDASCEEMWLAWRNGACLVPAPRSLVRSGMDLGPWLVARDITVVSTVPTLASLWPPEALEAVRLLIFGGESCPPELADRLAVEGREVWNTYGPTEATVVACAAPLSREGPVRIGLPLRGWDLAVVDPQGQPVAEGEVGELVIGGVGLARYLDPAKDAEKYAPMPSLGWERAYRSGDLVRLDPAGLIFMGRADDQVKVGGRRIELGEIDNALQNLPGVSGAAAAVRKSAAGNSLLIGYLVSADPDFDVADAHAQLRRHLPSAMVPTLALVDELPTRTSGKVDRDALPWPLPGSARPEDEDVELSETELWLARLWTDVLGVTITSPDVDFFAEGGGSLAAAQLVSAVRRRYPDISVADLYDHPRLGSMAEMLDARRPTAAVVARHIEPTPRASGLAQLALTIPLTALTGLQWATWLGVVNNVATLAADRMGRRVDWLVEVNWWVLLAAFLIFITPPGRMGIAAIGARLLLSGVTPGIHPRGGSVHVRLWVAERLLDASGAANLSGAPWMIYLARSLGAQIGHGVDLHTIPPVTGLLTVGDGASIEPEVDIAGWWIDGDDVHIGEIAVKRGASIGARSTLMPGAVVGRDAVVAPGSAVFGRVKARQHWAGSPAIKVGKAEHPWPDHRPPRAPGWVPVYGLSSLGLAAIPLISLASGLAVIGTWAVSADRLRDAAIRALILLPAATVTSLFVFAAITVILVRLASLGMTTGYHPVRSRVGWQVWITERLLDAARTYLFPLYASLLTPVWFRLLGAKVGVGTEISTALVLPKFTTIGDGAFLADDTMVASYELGGGWLHIDEAKIGKRSFLGNSGMTGPGRKVPKNGLVAVLSATPDRAKSGSSWLGSPPVRLRRTAAEIDTSRTFDPPLPLRAARALIETLRLIPVMVSFGLGVGLLLSLQYVAVHVHYGIAALVSGPALLCVGAIACITAAAAKWIVVGRISVGEHPLWSSFVWRNELSDAFVETVAAPWFANAATGTPILNLWLRLLGAKIGRGVWCETYWLPEADLVTLGDGATVQRGCVVQTHLFHDRVMAIDRVTLEAGATLGPHCVALPASGLGESATVGPASLVMRGDVVPAHTRWQGNPIAPWPRSRR
ncbi:amino acid adenylation domain-containing protein [Gordonia jinghuaiqii]|uniref:Amino acid adenylation domain-containing protein n=1 Tax=Gordonia jinghuaiqii TaxID=2758710 RepID=A0A7D7QHH9_9ACTN|nr:Pls/PosA family non-ribosomal peptide synthetase [Gordonia jinghuaiqii]MCR5978271.1 amino acid adenylation domain-containing protein [Gordonia jinghuaiqii]QMT01284.1 amino acid adenylation domain-containing protein [Gordonia jinghuaiqii]